MLCRYVLCGCLALAWVYGLFSLMQHFIQHDDAYISLEPLQQVSIVESVEPVLEAINEQSTLKPEPKIKPLEIETVENAVLVDADIDIQAPDLLFDEQEMAQLDKQQSLWMQPSTGGSAEALAGGAGNDVAQRGNYIGRQAQTKREVVPVATRRPNIPKVAYENKIDGWVLLAFNVNPDGRISDIQVMDAEPKGIFEANAVAAVRYWRYAPFPKKRRKDPEPKPVRVAQKVEFKWTMYSYNMDF